MSKREYKKMIKEITKYINNDDNIDFTYSFHDKKEEILEKFITDINEGNIKTKKEIIEISKLIQKKVININYFSVMK